MRLSKRQDQPHLVDVAHLIFVVQGVSPCQEARKGDVQVLSSPGEGFDSRDRIATSFGGDTNAEHGPAVTKIGLPAL